MTGGGRERGRVPGELQKERERRRGGGREQWLVALSKGAAGVGAVGEEWSVRAREELRRCGRLPAARDGGETLTPVP